MTPFGFFSRGEAADREEIVQDNRKLPEKDQFYLTPDQIELLNM
jgi:hypothetical protein